MSSTESGRNPSSPNEPAPPGPERSRRRDRAAGNSAASPPKQAASEAAGAEPSASPEPEPGDRLFGWSFREFLVPYILLALSMQRAHGYLIEQYLRGLGLVNLEMSTLYRTLRQLERDGLVCSAWEPGPEGPARRIYSLTDAGRWWLDAGASALAGYRNLIDRFFGSYSGPARGPDNDDEKGAPR